MVVDVIAGTSAGGINGIVLAKALARGVQQDPLREVWFDKASLLKLVLRGVSSNHRDVRSRTIHDLEYRHILHFHHDPQADGKAAFGTEEDRVLTLAVRST